MKKQSLQNQKSTKIGLLLISAVLILLFQNCSKVSFESQEKLESSLISRNGDAYGGKPSGDFYRYIPGFTCENKELPAASIEMTSSGIQLIENKKLLCGALKQNIDPSLIDTSIYQNEVIGYQEGIFEGSSTLPSKIPTNLVEVWCLDRRGEQGIETITYFDRTSSQAVNRIYYSVLAKDNSYGMKQTPDFPVARVLANKTILIKDGKGFELTVHRDQPASQLGLFKAEMNIVIEGQKISRETSCRLGGSLDPKVWPAQQIVDFDAKIFKFSPDFNHLVFTSDTATGIGNLYTSDVNGTGQKQVGTNMLKNGIGNGWGNFAVSPDSQWIIYNGDPRVPGVMDLFKTKIDGSLTTPIRIGLTSPNGVLSDFKITDSSVIYKESQGTQIKTVPLAGGSTIDLSPPISIGVPRNYIIGEIAASKNRIIYNFGEFSQQIDIYTAFINGIGIQKITPPFASEDWKTDPFRNIQILAGNKYAVIRRTSDINYPNFKNYLVAIDGSGFMELPTNMEVGLSSPDGNHILLSDRYSLFFGSPFLLLNIKNGSFSNLSAIPLSVFNPDKAVIKDSAFFTQDSRTLITPVLTDNAGNMKAISVSTDTGVETELCPGLISKSIVIKEESALHYLISSYDRELGIVTIYRVGPSISCQKLNSSVTKKIPSNSITEILISPDRQKLLVRLGVFSGSATKEFSSDWIPKYNTNQLLYVPLDGKPALAIDTPVLENSEITHASFLSDSRRVVFRGNQIKPSEYNVFLWTAPKEP